MLTTIDKSLLGVESSIYLPHLFTVANQWSTKASPSRMSETFKTLARLKGELSVPADTTTETFLLRCLSPMCLSMRGMRSSTVRK
mmetsp:Transcript_1844/g.4430  ORF Transcript_1844/g.4430 Transcript_1844/m.4430 type:complete len:85 (-) Transcript_1844:281-535(-)